MQARAGRPIGVQGTLTLDPTPDRPARDVAAVRTVTGAYWMHVQGSLWLRIDARHDQFRGAES